MNKRLLLRVTGLVMLIEAAFIAAMLILALCYRENVLPFLYTLIILVVIGFPLSRIKFDNAMYYSRDSFIMVTFVWLVLSAFGALPFFFNGGFGNYINCFFESMSGFTTTGATILTEIESLPKAILMWRSTTHFIGGMGILVLFNIIFPSGDDRFVNVMRAEMPGLSVSKLAPKLSQTSRILYAYYIGLTVLETIALLIVGIPCFDSITIAFSSAGTGGFAVKNGSIGDYNNPAAEIIITVFIVLFSINFFIYYLILNGNFKSVKKNKELWFFLLLFAGCTIAVTINSAPLYEKFGDCLRKSAFEVASIASTTGFGTVDFEFGWPIFSKFVFLLLMFTGGCAGATCGGIKCARAVVLLKTARQEIRHILHPRAVQTIKIDDAPADKEMIKSVSNFLAAYVFCFIVGALLVSLDKTDVQESFSAVLSCIGNVGPALGRLSSSFNMLSGFSKIVLSLMMLIGRLEIFPVLIFFTPSAWREP